MRASGDPHRYGTPRRRRGSTAGCCPRHTCPYRRRRRSAPCGTARGCCPYNTGAASRTQLRAVGRSVAFASSSSSRRRRQSHPRRCCCCLASPHRDAPVPGPTDRHCHRCCHRCCRRRLPTHNRPRRMWGRAGTAAVLVAPRSVQSLPSTCRHPCASSLFPPCAARAGRRARPPPVRCGHRGPRAEGALRPRRRQPRAGPRARRDRRDRQPPC